VILCRQIRTPMITLPIAGINLERTGRIREDPKAAGSCPCASDLPTQAAQVV
jgi:hypothetical protein